MEILDIFETDDYIQILILFVLVVTAYFALKGINETKNIHKETLNWNRMYQTQNILKELNDSFVPLKYKFTPQDLDTSFLIEEVMSVIEDRDLVSKIDKRLNSYESIARGIRLGLYDEELVKLSRRTVLVGKFFNNKNYIEHFRKRRNKRIYRNLEWLAEKWLLEINEETS